MVQLTRSIILALTHQKNSHFLLNCICFILWWWIRVYIWENSNRIFAKLLAVRCYFRQSVVFFQKVGFSRQKLKLVAKQRDEDLRAKFACDVAMYEPEMLVFLDETGSDKLTKYGYRANQLCLRSFSCVESVFLLLLSCQHMEYLMSMLCVKLWRDILWFHRQSSASPFDAIQWEEPT